MQSRKLLLTLVLTAALLTACRAAGQAPASPAAPGTGPAGGAGDTAPSPAPAGGGAAAQAGPVTVAPYGQGSWMLRVSGKGWYYDWLPGGHLLLQVGVGGGSVAEVDLDKGTARAWPEAPEHMMTAISPAGDKVAWPEKDGNNHRVLVASAGGQGQSVQTGSEDIYQIYWLSESALLIERPSGVQYLPLGGGQPTTFEGRRIMQVAGGAALLTDPRFPGPGLLVSATGASHPLPSGTIFALLSPDGSRLVWAPSLPYPNQPTATSWLAPAKVQAHGAAVAYARELRLLDVASGKELVVALPGALYIDSAAWQRSGGDLAVATHTGQDKDGYPTGGGLLRITPDGKAARLNPGSDYFDLGGFVADKIVVFQGDPRDFNSMKPVVIDAAGGSKPLSDKPVQYVDDPLGPPFASFATPSDITLIARTDGKRFVLPRKDLPKGTEVYPPELSPDGRWIVLRGEGILLLLHSAAYAAPAV